MMIVIKGPKTILEKKKKKSKTGILPIVIWPEVFAPLKYELPGEVKEWLSVPYNPINTTTEAGASHGGPHLQ